MIHRRKELIIFALVLGITLSVFSFFVSDLLPNFELLVFAVSLIVIGIPHGAVDHIISNQTSLPDNRTFPIVFYSFYLGALFLMAAIWYFNTTLGFLVFLLLSVYHFGITDVQALPLSNKRRKILGMTRGVMILTLIVFSDPTVTFAIITDLVQSELSVGWFFQTYSSVLIFSSLFAFVLFSLWIFDFSVWSSHVRSYFLDCLVLSVIFLISGPIVGFAIYFSLWHSLKHVEEYIDFRESKTLKLGIIQFYKEAWLFSAISIFGIVFLIGMYTLAEITISPLVISLITISALTLPHVVVIEKLYFKNN